MTQSWIESLGWAIFLACSWTWCIGMFLPVLLVRDFGVFGWIVFAVPNVIGAAAMGWVLRSREQSEMMVRAHRPMLRAFSFVTAAFQIFFALWIFSRLGSNLIEFALATIALACVVAMVSAGRSRVVLLAAAGVFVVSCACIVRTQLLGQLVSPVKWMSHIARPSAGVVWLTPVCVFGFLLCPYLDLTFHKARQKLSKTGSRIAFTLGFGLLFLTMILFTLAYATPMLTRLGGLQPAMRDIFAWWIEVHLCVQLGFTIGIHVHAAAGEEKRIVNGGAIAFLAAALGAGLAAALLANFLDDNEFVYRLFLAFYGLVLPAYVWLCMTPTRADARPIGRLSLVIWAIAVVAAAPMFWMGMIRSQMGWLVPGVGIVLLARLALLGRRWTGIPMQKFANDPAAGHILE